MYELSTISQAEVNASSGKNNGFVYVVFEREEQVKYFVTFDGVGE